MLTGPINGITVLIADKYNGLFYLHGFCPDHSYVQEYRVNKHTVVVGPKPQDEYLWRIAKENKEIDSTVVYTMFPKEKVTFLTKKSSSIELSKR